MIRGKHYEITAKNILGHELIGLEVLITESFDPSRKGMKGKVLDETQNTIVLETKKGKKTVPKSECDFEFVLGEEKVTVKGKDILKRPEDRAKNYR
jgi:ribonuclease P protein subunit POP4